MARGTVVLRIRAVAVLLCLGALAIAAPANARCKPPVVDLGLEQSGNVTSRWIEAIRDRVDSTTLARIQATKQPLDDAERSWLRSVERESRHLCRGFAQINAIVPAAPPSRVHILVGNQAGDDAFTAGGDTIVLDLEVFVHAYGESAGQSSLIHRVLLHEYSHLLLGPYMDRLRWSEEWADTDPFLRAVRVLYNEGIANRQSIQDPKWVNPDGTLTPLAVSTLDSLELTMLDRLDQLEAGPPPDKARELLRNISQGPFAGKWGALPIALWLQESAGNSPQRLRRWVIGGPQNILLLAVQNATPVRREQFARLLKAVADHVKRNRR